MQWGVVMEIKWLFHTAMLGFCSIQDIKTKQISLWKLILYGLVVFIMDIWKLLAGGEVYSSFSLQHSRNGSRSGAFAAGQGYQ